MKKSKKWIQGGSGDIGTLFVEVIGADNLPNMDKCSLDLRDKTDAFICLVHEDSVMFTEVIGDTQSPRWMPWTRRAFQFKIEHPSSKLLLAVFDHDEARNPLQFLSRITHDLHDAIGRVVVDVSGLHPDTTYTLTVGLRCIEFDAQCLLN